MYDISYRGKSLTEVFLMKRKTRRHDLILSTICFIHEQIGLEPFNKIPATECYTGASIGKLIYLVVDNYFPRLWG